MKHIVVISGKGGTGKTMLTASFAALAKNAVLVDCDVDAADLQFLLHPDVRERHEFTGGRAPWLDARLCTRCGQCVEACSFGAIDIDIEIDPFSCEGCAVCSYVCPEKAITMKASISGEWYLSRTHYGPFVHARLGAAEENSGKLVTAVKKAALRIAELEEKSYLIVDGPPGVGCPVVAALSGADLALVVTEPTLSGIHDMQRVLDVAVHFGIRSAVVINKFDINVKNKSAIEMICGENGVEVVGRIPFSRLVSEAIVNLQPVVKYSDNGVSREIIAIWERIK